jgi:hypothetical protein
MILLALGLVVFAVVVFWWLIFFAFFLLLARDLYLSYEVDVVGFQFWLEGGCTLIDVAGWCCFRALGETFALLL